MYFLYIFVFCIANSSSSVSCASALGTVENHGQKW